MLFSERLGLSVVCVYVCVSGCAAVFMHRMCVPKSLITKFLYKVTHITFRAHSVGKHCPTPFLPHKESKIQLVHSSRAFRAIPFPTHLDQMAEFPPGQRSRDLLWSSWDAGRGTTCGTSQTQQTIRNHSFFYFILPVELNPRGQRSFMEVNHLGDNTFHFSACCNPAGLVGAVCYIVIIRSSSYAHAESFPQESFHREIFPSSTESAPSSSAVLWLSIHQLVSLTDSLLLLHLFDGFPALSQSLLKSFTFGAGSCSGNVPRYNVTKEQPSSLPELSSYCFGQPSWTDIKLLQCKE